MERLTPVGLAFVGDAVYTLFARERIAALQDGVIGTLHNAASAMVNAKAQAAVFDILTDRGLFTAPEFDIARRAKNAHLHSHAKGATVSDYHKATALEAVVGYLHLSGDIEREKQLLGICADVFDEICNDPLKNDNHNIQG